MDKRRFIKDPIWGNIELMPWESHLLRQFLFNRLHHVIQTSNAYLVYPGLKYSRFVHSIGVLHPATQMFINLLRNSKTDYLDKLKMETKALEQNFPSAVQDKEQVITWIADNLGCKKEFSWQLSAIRVSALVHDLGHLPYSHTFEFALERFLLYDFTKIQGLRETQSDLDDETGKLHEELRSLLIPKDPLGKATPKRSVHEILGEKTLSLLIERTEKDQLLNSLLKSANQILYTETFPISKSIISSDIDADRIDFIHRDVTFSGLFKSGVDYQRLFALFELAERQSNKINERGETEVKKEFLPRPSPRVFSESEKLIWERFQSYKYVMSHHKVQLFDEILERLLFYALSDGKLNPLLKTIIAASNPNLTSLHEEETRIQVYKSFLSRFTDSWIDNELRNIYDEISSASDSHSFRLAIQDGLAERRDLFISLFKRDEDFRKQFRNETQGGIVAALGVSQNKYDWEKELASSVDTTVIIGDISNKLKTGISKAADFLGLQDLEELLKGKQNNSILFNVWYFSPDGKRRQQIEKEIVSFMRNKLKDYLLKA